MRIEMRELSGEVASDSFAKPVGRLAQTTTRIRENVR